MQRMCLQRVYKDNVLHLDRRVSKVACFPKGVHVKETWVSGEAYCMLVVLSDLKKC